MGRLVVQQFVSADGFAANDRNEFTLFDNVEFPSHDFDESNLAWLESVGAIVLGADTYRMFVDYWPTPASDSELVGPRINSLPKFVFSRSMKAAPWGDYRPATVVSGDAAEEIRRLKAETTGDVILWGSISLSGEFFDAGEVDLVRLVVVPVGLGWGRGVFPPGSSVTKLRLLGVREFESGLVELEYAVG